MKTPPLRCRLFGHRYMAVYCPRDRSIRLQCERCVHVKGEEA